MNNINVFLSPTQYSDPFLLIRTQSVRTFPEAEIRRENIPCATAGSLYINLDIVTHRPIDVIEHMNRPGPTRQHIA
jgi:hypothetical protein